MFRSLFAANHEAIIFSGYVDIFRLYARKLDVDFANQSATL
jgi:hypothetical protein